MCDDLFEKDHFEKIVSEDLKRYIYEWTSFSFDKKDIFKACEKIIDYKIKNKDLDTIQVNESDFKFFVDNINNNVFFMENIKIFLNYCAIGKISKNEIMKKIEEVIDFKIKKHNKIFNQNL